MKNEILLKGLEVAKSMGFETRVGGYDLEYFSLYDKETSTYLSIQQTPYFKLAQIDVVYKPGKNTGSATLLFDNLTEINEETIRKAINAGKDYGLGNSGIKKITLDEFVERTK